MFEGIKNRLTGFFDANKNAEARREALRKGILGCVENNRAVKLEIPCGAANILLDYMLERSYLDDVSKMEKFAVAPRRRNNRYVEWIRIDRLPVPPGDNEEYDLLARWQSVLSSLHAWNKKLYFLLKRESGQTSICVGIESFREDSESYRLHTSLINSMPGVMLSKLSDKDVQSLNVDLNVFEFTGAVTGIPSVRSGTKYSILQTLDQLAFGIRNDDPNSMYADSDFALVAIADPICDAQICDMISRYNQLGSDIHSQVRRSITNTDGGTQTTAFNGSLGIGAIIGLIAQIMSGGVAEPILGGTEALIALLSSTNGNTVGKNGGESVAKGLGGALNIGASISKGISFSHAEGHEFLNKFAQYSEMVIDHHAKRLREGRNLGFWNVGLYVLANSANDVKTVLGMLRSVYSGDESYYEPIRVHIFQAKSGADQYVKRGEFVPIINPSLPNCEKYINESWHLLGDAYQYVSTPLNTAELSIATSLPRKDVPGIRFVKNAVRFANNPGDSGKENSFSIGRIKDTGVEQLTQYCMNVDALVRHTLVTGGTGCGKTTTCKKIIGEVLKQRKHVLIIEPAKDEWARWAASRKVDGEDINLFMPGMRTIEGVRTIDGVKDDVRVQQLKINLFQPAAIAGARVDIRTHCERVIAMLNRCLPVDGVLPIIIDEAVYRYLEREFGQEFYEDDIEQKQKYPKLEGVLPVARDIIRERKYDKEISDNLLAALESRFSYFKRGKRNEILNVNYSTRWEDLFGKTTVVNLSKLANPSDRALIMSGLLFALREYRASEYEHNAEFRNLQIQSNPLSHLTVIEEAHNVLTKPTHEGAEKDVADQFSDMLSEIRSYGEGLMIIDQVPTRLIPDVIKNTHYKIAHRMSSPDDYQLMSAALGLRTDQMGVIPLLAQGEAIILGDRDDAASWVKVEKEV